MPARILLLTTGLLWLLWERVSPHTNPTQNS